MLIYSSKSPSNYLVGSVELMFIVRIFWQSKPSGETYQKRWRLSKQSCFEPQPLIRPSKIQSWALKWTIHWKRRMLEDFVRVKLRLRPNFFEASVTSWLLTSWEKMKCTDVFSIEWHQNACLRCQCLKDKLSWRWLPRSSLSPVCVEARVAMSSC